MKTLFLLLFTGLFMLTGCDKSVSNPDTTDTPANKASEIIQDSIQIELSDTEILVNGVKATNDEAQSVYIANDIIYYEEGHDFTYGEGDENDEHSKQEADSHTVVHITQPGNYMLSGTMSAGQIAIDLGDNAKEDTSAVVNLCLNGINITNTVAPAVIFYNAYEPFNDVDEKTAAKDVDTSSAGANIYILDGTTNTVSGSHVARIYKPDSVVLNEDGTKVIEEKKLHKYDAAFYSKVTMNMNGGEKGNGILNIIADNEGLDSEMHLTVNGGIINIESGNDGINTNEDGVSVTTLNGGTLNILVNGSTGEGDGIDSNGWLVINGGTLTSQAYGFSMDGGIDSDMGIHINGGTVIASGNMLDRISESNQTYAVFNFNDFPGEGTYTLKNSEGIAVAEKDIQNKFSTLIISTADLKEGEYTLWYNDSQLAGAASEGMGMFGGGRPGFPMGNMPKDEASDEDFNGESPAFPEDFDPENIPEMNGKMPPQSFNGERPEIPEGFNPGSRPEMNDKNPTKDFNGEGSEMPEGFNPGSRPEMSGKMPPKDFSGERPETPEGFDVENAPNMNRERPADFDGKRQEHGGPGGNFGGNIPGNSAELSEIFTIISGANYFSFIEVIE